MTLVGLVIALVSLLIFAILINVFWPLINTITTGIDPIFRTIIDFAIIVVGIGIIVEIIQDASRGSQTVPYG